MTSSAPPFPMRHIVHNRAKKYLMFAAPASILSGIAWYVFYTEPRRKKYEQFFEQYDPYVRMQEICSYPVKFLDTCPSVLLQRVEQKGLQVKPLENVYKPPRDLKGPEEAHKVHQTPSLPVS